MQRPVTNTLPIRLALWIACAIATVEAQNYMKMNPPPDADKPFPVPAGDNSCWMATAANMLAGAGYGNGATVQARADDIYGDLIAHYGVANGGWADTALNWWLGSPNNIWPANPYTVVNVYGNKVRVPYAVPTIPQDIGNQLRLCNLVGLSISWPQCNSASGTGGHAITDWGDNVASADPLTANPGQVIVTDSDADVGGNFTTYTYDPYAAPNPGGCNHGNGWYFNYSAAGFHPFIKHYVVLSPTLTPSGGTATYTAGGSTKLTNTSNQSATDLHYDALMWDDDCHHGYEVLTYRTTIDWNTANSPAITEQYCDNGKLNGISVDWDLSDNPVPPGTAVTIYTELILNAGNFLVYSNVHFTYPEGGPLRVPGLAWHLLTPQTPEPDVPHATGGYVIGLVRYESFGGAILEARLQHQYAYTENPEQHTVSILPGELDEPIIITETAFGHSYGLLSLAELENFAAWMTESQEPIVVQPNEPYQLALDWTGRLPYPIGDDPIPVSGPGVVSIERLTPTTVRLSWTGPLDLYEAPEIFGQWTKTSSQENPQVIEATESKKFYRTQDPGGEVHSVNVVSYINVAVRPGFQIICNPLQSLNPRDNWIDPHLPPILPEGTTVYRYGPQGYQASVYEFGEWTDPNMPLPPGVGFWLQLPSGSGNLNLLFAGECLQGSATNLPLIPGFQLIASTVPQAGRLQTDLGYPVLDGDVIYKFDAATQSYRGYFYEFGFWGPSEPVILPEDGFWVLTSEPRTWVRNYVIP